MALNQAQQLELQNILDSDLFKRATEEVLRMSDGSVDHLEAPEAGIKMALEKGVRNAFRLLRKISIPETTIDHPKVRPIQRTRN
jgi:hypothetical protein